MLTTYTRKIMRMKLWMKLLLIVIVVWLLDLVFDIGVISNLKRTFNVENFSGINEEIEESKSTLTCTMYYTEWCGYCKKAKPEWSKITDEYNNKTLNGKTIIITKINCEENPEIAKEQGVEGYPTFKFSLDGQEQVYSGERTYNAFKQYIEGIVHNDRS